MAKGAYGLGGDGVVEESADEWKGRKRCAHSELTSV